MRAIHIGQSITPREESSLNRYLFELDHTELLSMETETELAKRIREGDRAAVERLVRANLRFVVSCAKKYANLGLPLSDLINEGNIGLMKAATRFDERRGFRFISYAVWWIRQQMMAALSEQVRLIRLPGNMVKATSDIRKVADGLEQRLERSPTWEEITAELHVPSEEFARLYAFDKKAVSLDMGTGDGDGAPLWTLLEDAGSGPADSALETEGTRRQVASVLHSLEERERLILERFFGLSGELPMNAKDIALLLGISFERVRQIKEGALRKLRKSLKGKEHLLWTA